MLTASEVRIPNGWKPREYQLPLWRYLQDGGKRGVAVWHRRAGKDDLALHWTARCAVTEPATYWHMLPEAAQARKAIWEAINPHTGKRRIDEAFPREIRAATRENEMFIRFKTGSTWQVVGSDNYNSLVGAPPKGVVLSEWALANPQAWAYLRPILLENGGWSLFIYTPRGRNHGATTFEFAKDEPAWFADIRRADETGVFSIEQLESERREYIAEYGADIGNALFEQEYLCSFQSAVMGAYWGREMMDAEKQGRIGNVSIDPGIAVNTVWDLGVRDKNSIWFYQVVGRDIMLVDYYEASGYGVDHYKKVLTDKGYAYGEHWAPHDIKVQEWGTGKTRLETAAALGINFRKVPEIPVEDGINAARRLLPRCWFDKRKTETGVAHLRSYKTEWDAEKKVFKAKPLHDVHSNGADAFRYLAVSLPEVVTSIKVPEPAVYFDT